MLPVHNEVDRRGILRIILKVNVLLEKSSFSLMFRDRHIEF